MADQHYDYIIIGAGPAGLNLGYFLEQAGRSYRILEAGPTPGSFFQRFPRHRKLISINKIYSGYDDPEIQLRWDWNSLLDDDTAPRFREYSARYFPSANDMVRYLEDFATHHRLKVVCGARVTQVDRDERFTVTTADSVAYTCDRLVVATGVSQPYIPPIKGIEHAEQYVDVPTDPQEFANQRVLIIGKGNSAFETADNLIEHAALIHLASPHPLRMAWQTHFVGNLRAVNNNLLDTYQLKSQNSILDATVDEIRPRDGRLVVALSYSHAEGEREEISYDRVIACCGFRFDERIFTPACRPALTINERFPLLTSAWESATVPGMYFIGTLMQSRDYRKTTSGFIHGFRYNVRCLFNILERHSAGQPWPHHTIGGAPEQLAAAVLARLNRSSALWQQFGFLCDVVVPAAQGAHYYEEIPVDYLRDNLAEHYGDHYTVTLEYGAQHHFSDPFNVARIHRNNIAQADQSHFLHPIIRHWRAQQLLAEHHIIEDLASEWQEDVHREPLLAFFQAQQAGAV